VNVSELGICYNSNEHTCFRHPTSCCSAAEIMSTLFFYAMKYKVDKPRDPANDRFVLSKVVLYSGMNIALTFNIIFITKGFLVNKIDPNC
jgi:transketolase N-terminal domain/subunit